MAKVAIGSASPAEAEKEFQSIKVMCTFSNDVAKVVYVYLPGTFPVSTLQFVYTVKPALAATRP